MGKRARTLTINVPHEGYAVVACPDAFPADVSTPFFEIHTDPVCVISCRCYVAQLVLFGLSGRIGSQQFTSGPDKHYGPLSGGRATKRSSAPNYVCLRGRASK